MSCAEMKEKILIELISIKEKKIFVFDDVQFCDFESSELIHQILDKTKNTLIFLLNTG